MDFSEIKTGDTIKVTVAAHMARKNGLGGGAKVERAEAVRIVRVDAISGVNGQPGRKVAGCTVLVNERGEDFRGKLAAFAMPTFDLYSTYSEGAPAVTIERAE